MPTWTNMDGLPVRFGTDQGNRGDRAGSTNSEGAVQHLVMNLTFAGAAGTRFPADNNNDGTADGFNGLDGYIPNGAKIIDVDWVVTTALAGGTGWEVGTYQVGGTAIDADGIVNDNVGVAEVGAQLNATMTQNAYLALTTVGTYTAGAVTLIVSYIK